MTTNRFQVTVIGADSGALVHKLVEAASIVDAARQGADAGEVVQVRRVDEASPMQWVVGVLAIAILGGGMARVLFLGGLSVAPFAMAVVGLGVGSMVWAWARSHRTGELNRGLAHLTGGNGAMTLLGMAVILQAGVWLGESPGTAGAAATAISMVLAAIAIATMDRFPWRTGVARPA